VVSCWVYPLRSPCPVRLITQVSHIVVAVMSFDGLLGLWAVDWYGDVVSHSCSALVVSKRFAGLNGHGKHSWSQA